MVLLFFLSSFLIFSVSNGKDLFSTKALPWSAYFIRTGADTWLTQDLKEMFPSQASELYSHTADLKLKNNLRCTKRNSVLETTIPSLGHKKVTTRSYYSPATEKMNFDIFVKQDGHYEEVLRSSFLVRHGEGNYGQISKASMLDITNKNNVTMGFINNSFLTSAAQALGSEQSQIEANSDFGRDWLSLLGDAEQGYICCSNRLCRQHLGGIKQLPEQGAGSQASL